MSLSDIYYPTVLAMLLAGLLFLVQLLVADVAGIIAKHKPGHPISADSRSFLFRAARAHANTNESIAIFVIFAVVGLLVNANSSWLNALALLYVGGRAGHMATYYAGWSIPRSIMFGVSLLALLGMSVTVFLGYLSATSA